MEYRALGRSGLRISVLTMGTMTFGGTGDFADVGATDVEEAERQVDMCLEAGVNLIDTADVYSSGLAEEILGQVLRGRRDRVLVATKVRMGMGRGPNDSGLSRHHIISGCEASLRRLGTDHIDLYQVHEWDGQTPLEETLHALDHLVASGKVRYVGASNYAAWQLMKALGIAGRLDLAPLVSQQIYYSLQAREAEYELIPLAVDQGLGVLVWSPLAGGLLSGKYRRNHQAPVGSRQLSDWGEPPVHDPEGLYDIVEILIEIGLQHGVSGAQVALAWTLGQARRDLRGHRRPHRRAASRQPRSSVFGPPPRRARPARRRQRPRAHLPLLAPGQDRPRPAVGRRPDPARPVPGLTAGCSGRSRPRCPALRPAASGPPGWRRTPRPRWRRPAAPGSGRPRRPRPGPGSARRRTG